VSETIREPRSKAVAFALVILIFVALGPPVGSTGMLIFVVMGSLGQSSQSIGDQIGSFLLLLFVSAPLSYIVGATFAFVAGVVVATTGIFMRWNNFISSILAGVAALLLVPLMGQLSSKNLIRPETLLAGLRSELTPVCLLAAFVCWFVTRGIVRATWQNA
jgi:hypothetical protein